jgi:hypothetical protein
MWCLYDYICVGLIWVDKYLFDCDNKIYKHWIDFVVFISWIYEELLWDNMNYVKIFNCV